MTAMWYDEVYMHRGSLHVMLMLWLRSRAHWIQSEINAHKLTNMCFDKVAAKQIKVPEQTATNIAHTVVPSYYRVSKESEFVDFNTC